MTFSNTEDKGELEKLKTAIISNRKNKSFKIEVSVPSVDQSCFLAMTEDCSKSIYTEITSIVEGLCNENNSKIKQLKQTYLKEKVDAAGRVIQKEKTYVETSDIHNAIRSSELLIAVYRPTVESKNSSSEVVLYEAGMAHALGKPTILITNKEFVKTSQSFIFDETPKFKIVHYQPSNGLDEDLEAAVKELTQNIRNPFLVDSNVEEIAAIPTDWLIFKDHFQAIVKFGLETIKEFSEQKEYCHALTKNMEEIYEISKGIFIPASFEAYCDGFKNSFKKLEEKLQNNTYLKKWEKWESDISKRYNVLSLHLTDDSNINIIESRDWYENILGHLLNYPSVFQNVKAYENLNFGSLKDQKERNEIKYKIMKLNGEVRILDDSLKTICINAQYMIDSLLKIMGSINYGNN
jgi:hemoglobin-like flavoprotein